MSMTDIISTQTLFAIGDGATQVFSPARSGVNVAVNSVRKTDWQGNRGMYATPRTNYAKYSNQPSITAAWLRSRIASIVEGAITGPDGTNGAALITTDGSVSGSFYIYQPIPVTAGVSFPVVAFVKPVAGQTTQFNLHDFGTGSNVKFDLVGAGAVLSTSGNGVASSKIERLPSGFYRVEASFTPSATGSANVSPFYLLTPNSSMYLANVQIGSPGSYINTQGTPVTVTDYTVAPNGDITFFAAPVAGAQLTWTGQFDPIAQQFDASDTVISQYANSPTLTQLVDCMAQYFDLSTDFKQFFDAVWNINTAKGFGLDVWGKIVNVPRTLTVSATVTNFGFTEQGGAPFNQAPFSNGDTVTQTYALADDAYRTLIMAKALANISRTSASSINALLRAIFPSRGRCYVADLGNMKMMFTFEFALQPYELAIVTQAGVISRPAGVSATLQMIDLAGSFGFAEQGGAPFNQGVFFNPATSTIPVNN